MVKLALAAGRGAELQGARAVIVVDGRVSDEAYSRLGETALVYLHVDGVILQFVGEGRIKSAGLGDGTRRVVTLEPYAPFAAPVPAEPELEMPGARRMLEIEDARFDEIVASSNLTGQSEAEEAGAAFASTSTVKTTADIADQVLRAWHRRCAFTGREGPLRIVAIRPRDQGGPLHVGNYIPMAAGLEGPWCSGHFTVGEDFRVLGDLYRLAPEDQDSMVALYKMLLPEDRRDYPSAELLAWHRLNIFGRS